MNFDCDNINIHFEGVKTMQKYNFFTTNEIKPSGWLKRQLEIQAEGLGGNLDRIWPDVADSAWIGGSREGWERVPYWLDGFVPLAYLLDNTDMKQRAKRYMDAIIASQKPDGWICPCSDEERSEYDSWAVLLISKVLVVYYDCTQDDRIPNVLYRVLKNYYDLLSSGELQLINYAKYRWFEGFIAIRFLYERCHENWLLELAKILSKQGADYNGFTELWKVPLNRWRYETHIVNIAMALKAEALTADILKNSYTDNATSLCNILDKYNGTPTGIFTGDECLAGLSPVHGTELCSVVELMYSYEWLYAYTGDEKWAERLELAAFNALPATISEDMWTHQYDQLSNQIACEIFPGKPIFRTNYSDAHIFGLEPNFGCCTANFGQGWPKFALAAYMHTANTVINVLPVPSKLKTDCYSISLETDYPFNNSFRYHISAKTEFTFIIRIPTLAERLVVNGKESDVRELEFKIKPSENTVIDISFETKPAFIERPYGLATARCGSLVFSLPIKYEKCMHEYARDNVERKYPYCDYELIPTGNWAFAFADEELKAEHRTVGKIPFSESAPPMILKTKLCEINWGLLDGYETVCDKIPHSTVPLSAPVEMELYPYGCAKLRMTEMPYQKSRKNIL